MRIIIDEGKEKTIKLVLPTGMVLNRLTASMAPGLLEKKGIIITGEQMLLLIQALRRCRRHHPEWKLVEIDSSKGEHIEISL